MSDRHFAIHSARWLRHDLERLHRQRGFEKYQILWERPLIPPKMGDFDSGVPHFWEVAPAAFQKGGQIGEQVR
jgi:hypothetical protein